VTGVLVVEDEPQLLRALSIHLRALHYEVRGAASGGEALRLASACLPDLVILDLGLPDMDGTEVIAGLRGWTDVPILVLSGRTDSADKVDALDAGADDYVTKPFGMAELVARLTEFKLEAKTRLSHGEFQTTDLSSGQRRRLALIVAQLEKRPLLMLDEWAADQDPEFRRKFYFEFLPALHRAGVTVVAISHDDRYIDEMDVPMRRLRMDEGRFTELSSVETG